MSQQPISEHQIGISDPAQRLGLTIALNAEIGVDEAVEIADVVKDHGFRGATFAPKRRSAVVIYHTDNLGMTGDEFEAAATVLLEELIKNYPTLSFGVQKFLIHMPKL